MGGFHKKKVKNALSEGAEEAATLLAEAIEEMRNTEAEIDVEEFKAKVLEILEGVGLNETATEEVENMIAEKMKAVQNSISKDLSKKVRNSICAAILKSGKGECKNSVEKVLVENGINGLTFNDVVDYNIVEKWGDDDALYKRLFRSGATKFFINKDDMTKEELVAHGWVKTSASEKIFDDLTVTGKVISTDYVYKAMGFPFADLDAIGENAPQLLGWIKQALQRLVVNTIVKAILIGDAVNADGSKVHTFETIATASASETDPIAPFVTVLNPDTAGVVTIEDLRKLVDSIHRNNNEEIVLCIRQSTLTSVLAFRYAEGGSTIYHSNEDLAKMVGADEIYVTDYMQPTDATASQAPYAVAFVPSEYWVVERNSFEVSWPYYERNTQKFMFESNTGGAIHGLKSAAVLRKA